MQSAYLYSGTYTNILTTQLLSPNQRELLLSARSEDEMRTALLDTPFAAFLGQEADVRSVAMRFAVAEKERLLALAPDVRVLSILFLRYDYANAKQILLGEQALWTKEEMLAQCTHLGTINPPVLYEAIKNGRLAEYSEEIAKVYSAGKHVKSDEVLGDIFDSGYLTHALSIANKYKRTFIERYMQLLIDHHNISSQLRVLTHPENDNIIVRSEFVQGGTIAEGTLADLETALAFLEKRSNTREWIDALELFKAHRDFSGIDKALDNQFAQFLKTESLDIHEPTSLFAYFHAVMENVQYINAIYTAHKAGLDTGRLRSIIRKSFLEHAF